MFAYLHFPSFYVGYYYFPNYYASFLVNNLTLSSPTPSLVFVVNDYSFVFAIHCSYQLQVCCGLHRWPISHLVLVISMPHVWPLTKAWLTKQLILSSQNQIIYCFCKIFLDVSVLFCKTKKNACFYFNYERLGLLTWPFVIETVDI